MDEQRHGIAPSDPRPAAHADAITLGAEDLRIEYFRLFDDDAASKQATFVEGRWAQRWLPNLDGLLELNGDRGFLVGESLTHADVAVWDILDSITEWVAGATLDGAPRLKRFFVDFRARPRIGALISPCDQRVTFYFAALRIPWIWGDREPRFHMTASVGGGFSLSGWELGGCIPHPS